MGFKTKNWSHLEEDQTVERERGKEKREEEESSNYDSKWPKNSLKVGPCTSQILVSVLNIE